MSDITTNGVAGEKSRAHSRDVPVCFASGSNRPSDIRGFAAIERAIGVAVPELSPESVRELIALAGRGLPVFVDSGAFSEVEFGPAGPVVVRPLTTRDWERIFTLYRRLAAALGSDVYLVACDRIGDQEHSLALLTAWEHEIRELAALGANVLVPIQKGTRSQAEYHRDVERVLAGVDFIPAIPSKKNATTVDEPWATMILVAMRTGLRRSELRALRWIDVDLVGKRLLVRQALDDRGVVGLPKNGRARDVPLSDDALAALKAHRHLRGPLVFCNPDGTAFTQRQMEPPIARACRRAGLREIGWHVLRHTFASHLAMRGYNATTIQSLGGWETISMVNRYAHLSPDARREAVQALDSRTAKGKESGNGV